MCLVFLADQWQSATSVDKSPSSGSPQGHPLFADTQAGHGRVDTRFVHASAIEPLQADFPYARSLTVVRNCRTIKKTQKTTTESHYYLSSLPPEHYQPA